MLMLNAIAVFIDPGESFKKIKSGGYCRYLSGQNKVQHQTGQSDLNTVQVKFCS